MPDVNLRLGTLCGRHNDGPAVNPERNEERVDAVDHSLCIIVVSCVDGDELARLGALAGLTAVLGTRLTRFDSRRYTSKNPSLNESVRRPTHPS